MRVYFPWDRRNKSTGETTRAVRVSQGWAGAGYGFTMIPRRMHEVVVAYINGDPDEPLIVGRVHNETAPPPLKLPDDKTQSIWLSRSSPAPKSGSAGFNRIMMEDKAGSELLDMYAQLDYKRHTNRNEAISVGGNQSTSVGGSESHSNHDYTLTAKTFIKENAGTTFDIHANGGYLHESASADVEIHALGGNLTADASANVFVDAKGGMLSGTASSSILASAGSDVVVAASGNVFIDALSNEFSAFATGVAHMDAPSVVLNGDSVVELASGCLISIHGSIIQMQGSTVTVSGSSKMEIKGGPVTISGSSISLTGGPVTIAGTPIKLNC